jgi:hypothetical protein
VSAVTSRADPQEVMLLDENTLDPNKTYRWVHNAPTRLAQRRSQGYRLVSRKDDKVKTLVPEEKAPDDYIYNGDSVLMCCDTATVESRRGRTSAIATARLGTPVSQFRKEHQTSGARNSSVLVDEEGEER